jgi:hypothetical protein
MFVSDSLGQSVRVPIKISSWDTLRAKVTEEVYLGKESILLQSGAMLVKGADVRDGVIEADISFPQQRGFPGFAFRFQDPSNFENFYVRPHQSGNPDATQYTPVFNGQAGWQLYHGEGYSSAFTFKFNEWHHIKIDMHGLQAEIYIDDMQKPLIKVAELKTGWKGGTFGIIAGGTAIRFANVQYTTTTGSAPTPMAIPATGTDGVITQWQVSNVVNGKLFTAKSQITSEVKKQINWTSRPTEPSGTINLSKFGAIADSSNTMVAKVTI